MNVTVAPAAFIPMTCHRWLMVLFPMTKSSWPVTKKLIFGWSKLCWFQLYCSKTLRSFSLILARHITWYIHIILTIFQEATLFLTLWTISLKNVCKNFIRGVFAYPFPYPEPVVFRWQSSNFISHFIGHVIIHPCWDYQCKTMLVKGYLVICIFSLQSHFSNWVRSFI